MDNIGLFFDEKTFLEMVRCYGNRKSQTYYDVIQSISSNVKRVSIDDRNYILKQSGVRRGLAGIASSRMYNEIGIQTPPMKLVYCDSEGFIRSLQPDISRIAGLELVLANNDLEYLQIDKKIFGNDKWQVFYDLDLMQAFLQFMTPDCLEQLKNMYLVDELRTDRDRWLENFYLCRIPGHEKYEGVIAIDLEELAIYQFCGAGKHDFENFLNSTYYSSTPQQTIDGASYKSRLWEILNLAYDGVLSKSNISVIKAALGFDLPKELEKLCDCQKLSIKKRKETLEPIKRLWEYNNSTIGKEFEN